MQNSVSDFFVYNSTGKLLSGDGEIYSNEYSNLAKQIDSKRNALYFELLHTSSTLILGCSVIVEEVGGREERIVCVGKYSGYNNYESKLIMQFYETVSAEISRLQKLEYRVVGLWEENDINDFVRLQELTADESMMNYVYGKLLANEKVSIKSVSAVNAVSLISSVFTTAVNSLEANLKFTASQYPYESDISICPIEPNPDFELDEFGVKWKQSPHYSEYYSLLPMVFREHSGEIKSYVERSDRKLLSFYTKHVAFKVYTWDVLDIFTTSESLYKLFDLYNDNTSVISHVFKERSSQIRQMPITNETTVANIVELYSKQFSSQNTMYCHMGEDEALKSLFERIRNADVKKKLDIILLRNRALWSYVIRDTIRKIYANEDKELLSALCNVGFIYGDDGSERFKNNVAMALSSYDNNKLIELLKIVANNVTTTPSAGGKIFVDYISTELRAYDLSSKLTTNEAEILDSYFGTSYVVAKQSYKKNKKTNTMMLASYAIVAIMLIAAVMFLLVPNSIPFLGNNYSSNSSITDDIIGFISGDNTTHNNESVILNTNNTSVGTIIQGADNMSDSIKFNESSVDSANKSLNNTANLTEENNSESV
ncbi:hypothetical protein [Methanolobus sp. ZRKC5]|uniref:hypothetical protein n=1 Tax=unclassified Methanolobus TaxID=2629569 RepID=UPI00313E2411